MGTHDKSHGLVIIETATFQKYARMQNSISHFESFFRFEIAAEYPGSRKSLLLNISDACPELHSSSRDVRHHLASRS